MDKKFLSIGMMAGTAQEKYRDLQRGCCETWVKECDKVYFFCGKHYDFEFEGEMVNLTENAEFVHFNELNENYESACPKFWYGLSWLMQNSPSDLYLMVGTDNYVKYDKVVESLKKFDPKMPYLLGGPMQHRCLVAHGVPIQVGFNIGGGGQVISHAALELIFNQYEGDRDEQVKALLTDWAGICVESNRLDLLPSCDVASCYMATILNIPMISHMGYSPIDCNGYQFWHANGCYFPYNKDNIIICHYMDRFLQNSYHKELGYGGDTEDLARQQIELKYNEKKDTPSDINEHIPTLYEYASKCKKIAEMGVRSIVSSWAFLKGLADNNGTNLYCIDIDKIDMSGIKGVAKEVGVDLQFIQGDSATVDLPEEVELLFIDTLHCMAHVKREQEHHHAKVRKYIIYHDTTVDEWLGEPLRVGMNIDELCKKTGYHVSEVTRGLWPGIQEFLDTHPEWVIEKRFTNNNGLTILKRVDG